MREEKGKKPLKASEKAAEVKDTKVSNTAPESGYMHRDNKPKGFFYLDRRTVDGKCGIILDTFATAGNVNDSQPYIARLDATTQRFQFKPQAVGLEAGYFTAPIAESLARREIVGVFGYRRPTKGKNSLRKRDFKYDADKDCYTCPMGQQLIYSTTTREGYPEGTAMDTVERVENVLKSNPEPLKRLENALILQGIPQRLVNDYKKLRLLEGGAVWLYNNTHIHFNGVEIVFGWV